MSRKKFLLATVTEEPGGRTEPFCVHDHRDWGNEHSQHVLAFRTIVSHTHQVYRHFTAEVIQSPDQGSLPWSGKYTSSHRKVHRLSQLYRPWQLCTLSKNPYRRIFPADISQDIGRQKPLNCIISHLLHEVQGSLLVMKSKAICSHGQKGQLREGRGTSVKEQQHPGGLG